MKTKARISFVFGLMLSAAVLSGCGKDDGPVSAGAPPTQPPEVDRVLIGTWYQVGTSDGIEFRIDGICKALYVYGNVLHAEPLSYYDGIADENFSTTPDGKCIFTMTYYATASFIPVTLTETCTYVLGTNNSTLTLDFGDSNAPYQRFYVRKAIGDVVAPM
jgi:hypothetical protein